MNCFPQLRTESHALKTRKPSSALSAHLRYLGERRSKMKTKHRTWFNALLIAVLVLATGPAAAQQTKPNIVVLMADDVGWTFLGVYPGGAAPGHPTPNIDRLAKEGAMFTSRR